MIILGIDPGSVITGYGVVEHQNRRNRLVTCGCVKPDPKLPFEGRLLKIYDGLLELVSDVGPDEVALETVFYGANVQTMMKMCHARGVILLALANSALPVYEYAPRAVKKAVVGKGGASKEQVQFMMRRLFKESEIPDTLDVSDAIAVALCHAHQKVAPVGGGRAGKKGLESRIEELRSRDGGKRKFEEKLKNVGVDARSRRRLLQSKRRGR